MIHVPTYQSSNGENKIANTHIIRSESKIKNQHKLWYFFITKYLDKYCLLSQSFQGKILKVVQVKDINQKYIVIYTLCVLYNYSTKQLLTNCSWILCLNQYIIFQLNSLFHIIFRLNQNTLIIKYRKNK